MDDFCAARPGKIPALPWPNLQPPYTAQGVRSNRVYAREALSRYTHVGKRRNFIKYAHRAADVHASSEIRAQVSDHMKWFKKAWRRERMKVFSDLTE